MARVVVIGAGLSGLAAAARLARLRHDVTVLEQSTELGGQAGRYERDGFAFDTGPTLLRLPATYRDLFIKTGKTQPLESVLDLEPVDPAVRWGFADGTVVDLPNASRGGKLEALGEAFGADAAEGWNSFLDAGNAIWEQFRRGFGTAPPVRWRDAARTATGRAHLAALQPARSLTALTSRHLTDPRLVQAAGAYALRLGTDPRRAAALLAIWPYMEHAFGTWRVVGGIRALVAAIAERAEKRGAGLRLGAPVRAIEVVGNAITGVRLADGERVAAEIVVAGVDSAVLGRMLDRGDRGIGSAPERERSASAVTLLLALRGATAQLPPTVSFPADPFAEYSEIFRRTTRAVTDPTMWLTRADAPPGHTSWTVQLTSPPVPVDDASADALVAVLDRRGFDVSSRLLWRELRTPAELTSDRYHGGAMAGGALHGRRALFRAPNITGVRGLFHVGAAAHPGPGIDLAPLGAALVAEAVGRA